MKIEEFGNNHVKVTDFLDGIKITIHAYARKPRIKSDAEIILSPNSYSKQINDAARSCILDFLEERLKTPRNKDDERTTDTA